MSGRSPPRGVELLVTGVAAAIAILLLTLPGGWIFALVCGLVVGLAASIRGKRWLATVLLAGLLARVLVILVDGQLGVIPRPPIEAGHVQHGIAVAQAWAQGHLFTGVYGVWTLRGLLARIIAPAHLLFGEGLTAGRLAIAIASTGIGYLTYHIATELSERRVGLYAAALATFWPSILYRSVVVQREVIVVTAMLAVVWAGVRWTRRLDAWFVPVVVVATWLVSVFRPENLVLVATVFGTVFLVRVRHEPRYLAAFALTIPPFLAFFATNVGTFIGIGGTISPELLDEFAYSRAHGDATYLVGYHYDSWLDVIGFLPVKVLYFLFAPFPWQIDGTETYLAGLSSTSLLVSAVFWRRGIATLADDWDQVLVVAAYLAVGIAAYSIIEMNFGAAFRRRIQFVPLLLVFVAAAFAHVRFQVTADGPGSPAVRDNGATGGERRTTGSGSD